MIEQKTNTQNVTKVYDDSLGSYFTDLKKCKPLKKEEERELLVNYKTKNDIVARQKLITSNLRYACSLVNKYKDSGVPLCDLIEEANCGLIEGIEDYDLKNDVRIITYAKWKIEYYLQKAVKNKWKSKTNQLPEEHQKQVSGDDIAKYELGYDNKSETYGSSQDVENIISILNEKEQDFIKMYYGLLPYEKEYTYQEISDKYNISKERVRQIIDKIMRKLRTQALIILRD